MNLLFHVLMTLTGFCAFGLVAVYLFKLRAATTSQRLARILNGRSRDTLRLRSTMAISMRLFAFTAWLREHLGMSVEPKLQERFEKAGILSRSQHDLYLVSRSIGALLMLVAASFISWNRVPLMLALPGLCYIAPNVFLSHKVRLRRQKIRRGIPDAIDLLVICVDAGLGLDQAMLHVAQEIGKRHPSLQQEFFRINREQRAGKQRLEAWQSMADRCQLPEVDGFVNMLGQTERFGTPIARALSDFGDGIRQKRRQRAEELAAKTTVKIIFPLVLCIFPSLFVVLLGPPAIKVAINGLGVVGW